MGSLIRSTGLWGYPDLVRELGGDPAPFLKRFGLREGVEREDDALVPLDAVVRILATTADELDCADFGLRLVRWQGLGILGPVAVIARNSDTVQEALQAIARYLYVHSPGLVLTAEPRGAGAGIRFTYEVIEPSAPDARQGYELSMANAVLMLRLLGGPDARLSTVSFLHEQMGSTAAYDETFGCPVRFAQEWCGFEIPADLAARPIDSADPETRRIATKYLEANYLPDTASMSERVAELVRRLLPTGHCTADDIADQLGMHERTLRRHLTSEGTGCHEVIDQERRVLAAKYLADPRLQFGQIAALLGYAEQSTLNRSCRRWFDKTPREYRSSIR
ncbi:AraC family transcriptional regulator [Nocardioides sp. WS12]|uniref:AraC family transcriptional regulator n=1 Tax=Nocardioides sp. WS12 TaxID=2486272 RepID=UPI0015FCE65E|nr:AraC family transcriptional regulator [Nocardioides sp. WS12]